MTIKGDFISLNDEALQKNNLNPSCHHEHIVLSELKY